MKPLMSLTVVVVTLLARPASAERVTPPATPANIQVPAGNRAFLVGHASGTQNYICLPSASGFAWTLFGPQATLFDDHDRQITTHFLSANPDENFVLRPTWQHSRDTSAVWGQAIQTSTDASFVAPDAIPWLLLRVVGGEDGPGGGDKLTRATYLQRVNTEGGLAPATGCDEETHVGSRAFVPYTADYVFYKAKGQKGDGDDEEKED
jgi:hypothetical protein